MEICPDWRTVLGVQVQLYIGNLSSEWQDDEAFVNAMSAYGELERCFVMRNADGLSKVQYFGASLCRWLFLQRIVHRR